MRGRAKHRSAVVALSLAVVATLFGCDRERSHPAVTLGEITTVSTATGVGTNPMFVLSPSGDRAIGWVSAPGGGTDGRLYVSVNGAEPTAIADPLGSVQVHSEAPPRLAYGAKGSLAALYVVAKEVGKRFPASALRFVRSDDGGKTWTTPVTITDDPAELGSHNFHALYAGSDGTLYASWLDGREGKSATYFTHSKDGGRTWVPNRRISITETCPCCRTAIAADGKGVVYAVWRTVLPGEVRDIVIARSADHGMTWTEPVRVHADDWVYPGCPHAGPAVQLDATGKVHVVWWTGKKEHAGVFYTTSADGARTFTAPVTIDAQKIPLATHVQLAVANGGPIVATWDGTLGMRRVVNTRISRDGGHTFGDAILISDSAHTAQYPVIGLQDNRAYVAWSQTAGLSAEHAHGAAPKPAAPPAGKSAPPKKMPLHAVGATQVFMREIQL